MTPGLERLIGKVEALFDRIRSEPPRCREFRLYRHTDAAGLSPGEILAVGVVLPSGFTVMEFCAAPEMRENWPGITELIAAHNDGRTEVVFLGDEE